MTEISGSDEIDEISEFIGRLIDAIEDFLWTRHVDLGNQKPRKEGDADDAIIYGQDYDDLFNDLFEVITTWEVF